MDCGKISHRTHANECYACDENRLVINLKTGYDVDRVYLYYGDPFSAGILGGKEKWSGERLSITKVRELKYHKLWTVTVRPPYKRCKYYFELYSQEECLYYFEGGFFTEEQKNKEGRLLQYFVFPWMNSSDINRTPDWVNDTVWYQIFPERFCNGDSSRNPEGVKPWKTQKVSHWEYYGGDLSGIRKKLPYLRELGITGIYLTPVFEAGTNHKYDTKDYRKIDPCFGDQETLIRLVQEAHRSGMRVMLDAVFNHCGSQFMPWRDVLEKGPKSEYYNWFMVQQWPFDKKSQSTRDGKFYSFAFWAGMPKLNTNSPEVVDYLTDICKKWICDYDIDGIRFDVGNEISHSFIKYLRKELKAIKPDVYLLGEIWHDAVSWLLGDEYDAVMNYPFVNSVNEFWIDKGMKRKEFEYAVNRCESMYQEQTNRVLFNLLDSHDTERLFSRTGNLGVFYQQLAVLFTMNGSPCIYYGTEIALEGGHDPDCRRCMPWDDIEQGKYQDRIRWMKRLIAIRKQYKACKSPDINFLYEMKNERLICYEKTDNAGGIIRVLLNCSEENVYLEKEGEILFEYLYENGCLMPNGTLILVKGQCSQTD